MSQFNGLLRCGEAFRLDRVGFPSLPAVYLAGGSAYHAATEMIDLALFENLRMDEDRATEIWMEAWDYQLNRNRAQEPDVKKWRKGGRASKTMPNREDVEVWASQGLEMTLAYLAYRRASDWGIYTLPDDSPAIEVSVKAMFGDAEVVGMIDRVMVAPNGEVIARDLKTGRKPDSHLQLGTYAGMLEETFGIRPKWGDYFLGRTARPTEPVDLDPYSKEYLAAEYGKVHQMRQLGLYLVNEGTHCISCGVREGCRLKGTPSAIAEYKDQVPEYNQKEVAR